MQQPNAEITTALLTESAVQQAVDTLQEEGFVILPEVLPKAWVTATRSAFTAELQGAIATGQPVKADTAASEPPLKAPFLDPQIIENPAVMQVLERALGEHFSAACLTVATPHFPAVAYKTSIEIVGTCFPS